MTRLMTKLISLLALAAYALAQSPGSFRVTGTVVNAVTGQPVPQARVRLSLPQERDSAVVEITTDAGRFQFQGVAPGKYVLAAGKPGFLMEGFNEHENYSTAVAVGPGLNTENLVFRLHAESIISGQITDEQNDPVPEAQVTLFQRILIEGQRTTIQRDLVMTDDRGMYRFGGLPPGTFFLAISARPWYAQFIPPASTAAASDGQVASESSAGNLTYPVTYYPGASDATGATPIVIAAGERVSADLRLVAVPSVHIRIKVPKINPNQGFSATLTPVGSNGLGLQSPVPAQTTMINSGEIEMSGIAPAQYHLQLVIPGKQPITYEQDINAETSTEIEASAGNSHADISGVARTSDGSGLPPGAFIVMRKRDSARIVLRAEIFPTGEFRFDPDNNLTAGKYDIRVVTANQDLIVGSVVASGAQVAGRIVEIAGSGPVRLTVTMTRGLARITGTAVSAEDGKPFPGAMILLVPENPESNPGLVRRDQSDSDGTFTLPSILPGHYTLLAIQNGWDLEWMNPGVLKPYLAKGQSVIIEGTGKYNLQVRVQ